MSVDVEQLRQDLIGEGITVGIDGPAGSGKSTVAKRIAVELGIGFLDTGAMYRALTLFAMDAGVDLDDHEAVLAAAVAMQLTMVSNPADPHYYLDSVEVTSEIRTPRVAEAVTKVSTNLLVRKWMAAEQRRRMVAAKEDGEGMIAEGRDITTVVMPDADVRVLLLADEQARLRRRTLELYGDDSEEHMAATAEQIGDRDAADSTVSSFLEPAPGVTVVDSSNLGIDEVVDAVEQLIADELAARRDRS